MAEEFLPRCLLLPIDGSKESLGVVDFLSRLYPMRERINLILCYFEPGPPPMFAQPIDSPEMARKKRDYERLRQKETKLVFEQARRILLKAGFPDYAITEHVEERAMSVAHQACMLAEIKKVDAVVIQKKVSSSLEGFMRGDSTPSLLEHCLVSPLWFTEGTVDVSRAAVCVYDHATSLRAADHAAFMLAETDTQISILHLTRSLRHPISSSAYPFSADLEQWLVDRKGAEMKPFLEETLKIMDEAGIVKERLNVTILPCGHNIAPEITTYCRRQGIGIVVLGYSGPTGVWGFLKSTITKKILADLRNMAVWVNQ